MTSKTAWTNAERAVADGVTNATGKTCKRNALSGSNNRADNGDPRPGDVVFHPDLKFSVLAEVKYRAAHAHHKLFREAQADAEKHGLAHPILFTKVKGETGLLTVIDAALFFELLSLPEVQKKLQRSLPSPRSKSGGSKSKPKPPKPSPIKSEPQENPS